MGSKFAVMLLAKLANSQVGYEPAICGRSQAAIDLGSLGAKNVKIAAPSSFVSVEKRIVLAYLYTKTDPRETKIFPANLPRYEFPTCSTLHHYANRYRNWTILVRGIWG
jgi:hypothetical protein